VTLWAVLAKLSSSALLESTNKLRGGTPAHEALVATGTAAEDSEDGVESAEAAVKEAEEEASQQETSMETSKETGESTDDTQALPAAIQTSKPKLPKLSRNASRALAKRSVCGPRNIRLTIKGATGLRGEDEKARGLTDPYCVCEVQGKPTTKVQTMALDGFHGVHWDHSGEIADFLAHDAITCSVYDQDALASDPDYFLGRTTLVGAKLLSEGFKGDLPLKDAGIQSALLKLEVRPLALEREAAAEDIQKMAKAGCGDTDTESDKDDKDDKDDADDDSSEGDA